jgi:hypothetical protein
MNNLFGRLREWPHPSILFLKNVLFFQQMLAFVEKGQMWFSNCRFRSEGGKPGKVIMIIMIIIKMKAWIDCSSWAWYILANLFNISKKGMPL